MASFTSWPRLSRAGCHDVVHGHGPRASAALAMPVLASFAGLAAFEASLPGPLPGGPEIARILSAVMVARLVRPRGRDPDAERARPAVVASRRPLFCGLGIAEALYGFEVGGDLGTAGSLLVCTVVAVLCARSAHLDLNAALQQTEHAIGSLNRTLVDVRGPGGRAVPVARQPRPRRGQRRGRTAGRPRGPRRTPGNGRPVGRPAVPGRDRGGPPPRPPPPPFPEEPCRSFDLGTLVRSIGESARAVGSDVSVRAGTVVALGRPDDVVAVLKNLLVNARRHAPGAAVELIVEERDQHVQIVCADDGPGLDDAIARRAFDRGFRGPASQGSGLGLYDARELMRAQGGDLVLEAGHHGARFVATLPTPAHVRGRIPSQRPAASSVHSLDLHAGLVL